MSIWHTFNIEGGNVCGRFSPVPRRGMQGADGERYTRQGFSLTVPKNGILDTEKLSTTELEQAEAVWGEKWSEKLDAYLKRHCRVLGLAAGLPGRTKKPVTSEIPADVEEKTAEYLKTAKVVSSARSAVSGR